MLVLIAEGSQCPSSPVLFLKVVRLLTWILYYDLVLLKYFSPAFYSTRDCNISEVNIACVMSI